MWFEPAGARARTTAVFERQDPALVSWAGGYCGAVKDMRLIGYSLAEVYDIETEADLPKPRTR